MRSRISRYLCTLALASLCALPFSADHVSAQYIDGSEAPVAVQDSYTRDPGTLPVRPEIEYQEDQDGLPGSILSSLSSKAPEQEDTRRIKNAINSTVQITMSGRGFYSTGSGTTIGENDGKWVILTNSHVVGSVGSTVSVQFYKDGKSLGWYKGRVVKSIMANAIDIGVVTVEKSDGIKDIAVTPLAARSEIDENKLIITVGCDGGKWPNLQLGHTVRSTNQLFYYLPTSYPGDSGSAVFNSDGSRVIGLTAWQTRVAGKLHGLAMPIASVKDAVAGRVASIALPEGCFSTRKIYETEQNDETAEQDLLDLFRDPGDPILPRPAKPLLPKSDEDGGDLSSGLFSSLKTFLSTRFDKLERQQEDRRSFLEARLDRLEQRQEKRENELLKRIDALEDSQAGPEDLADLEEVGILGRRGILDAIREARRLQRQDLEEYIEPKFEEQEGLIGGVIGRFNSLISMINIIWYVGIGLVVLTVIGVFAGNGWALSLLIWIFKAGYTLINAIIAGSVSAFNQDMPDFEQDEVDTLQERIEILTQAIEDMKRNQDGPSGS